MQKIFVLNNHCYCRLLATQVSSETTVNCFLSYSLHKITYTGLHRLICVCTYSNYFYKQMMDAVHTDHAWLNFFMLVSFSTEQLYQNTANCHSIFYKQTFRLIESSATANNTSVTVFVHRSFSIQVSVVERKIVTSRVCIFLY